MNEQVTMNYFAFAIPKHCQKTFIYQAYRSTVASWTRFVSLATVIMFTGCANETLFRSDFDPTQSVSASTMQGIGTAHSWSRRKRPHSCSPVLPSGKWVRISPDGPCRRFQERFSRFGVTACIPFPQ